MTNIINKRKKDHIDIITSYGEVDKSNYSSDFDQISLLNRALPELNLSEIDTSIEFLNYKLDMPLIISSMTGGSDSQFVKINQNLALAASKARVAFALGSQRIMKHDKNSKKSFDIKDITTNIPIISNVGAVQLNYELNLQDIEYFIEFLDASGLYMHCNPLQEAIQSEGNTNFKNLISKIAYIAKHIKVPVILKEVGCGLSKHDIELGINHNIKHFDLAGSGGTSWSLIEYLRSSKMNAENENILGYNFQNWGISTVRALHDSKEYRDRAYFIASGGIRNGLDIAKSIILGASMVGIAKPFLKAAQHSAKKVENLIKILKQELKLTMFLLGVKNLEELFGNENLILNKLNNF